MSLKKALQVLSDAVGIWGGWLFVYMGWVGDSTEAKVVAALGFSLFSLSFEQNAWWRIFQGFFLFEALVSAISIYFLKDVTNFTLNACAISGVLLMVINGYQVLEKIGGWTKKVKDWLDEHQPT